ncbi:hypothetical protein CL689_03680 [Candidatus Saccharibacteria bacterium]|nr:hypothetical protein [Candidatus Saccharibacteria bacterium]|tara:strand:- start:402 stop:845 length:444 start_codon:yes stop_codon:yes gene_type:complete
MSVSTEFENIFSTELVKETSTSMGLVEKKLYGLTSTEDIANRMAAFLNTFEGEVATGEKATEEQLRVVEKAFNDFTANLPMSELVEFFSVLGRIMDSDLLEGLFSRTPVNEARYEHLRRVVSINLMFAKGFKSRLSKTIALSKEWCS